MGWLFSDSEKNCHGLKNKKKIETLTRGGKVEEGKVGAVVFFYSFLGLPWGAPPGLGS